MKKLLFSVLLFASSPGWAQQAVLYTGQPGAVPVQVSGGGGTGSAAVTVTTTFSATPTFTCPSATAGTLVTFVLSTALTTNITSSTLATCGTNNQRLGFIFTQDGTGARTVAYPTGFGAVPPVSAVANATTVFEVAWNGTTAYLLGYNVTGAGDAIILPEQGTAPAAITGSTVIYSLSSDSKLYAKLDGGAADEICTLSAGCGAAVTTCFTVYQPGNKDCVYFLEDFRGVWSASRFGVGASWNTGGAACGNITGGNFLAMNVNIGIVTSGNGTCYALADGSGVIGEQKACPSFGTGSPFDTWKLSIQFGTSYGGADRRIQVGCTDDTAFAAGSFISISYTSVAGDTCDSGTVSTTNFMLRVGTAGTDTCIDLGLAPSDGGEFVAEIEGTTPGTLTARIRTYAGAFGSDQTVSTNVPTAFMYPSMLVNQNSGSVTRVYGVNFYLAVEK